MKNVFLTGFMGTGKSSVGKILAERLSCKFIDLDALIVADAGMSIKEIFAAQGEPYFRALEANIVRRLVSEKGAVVSTGGGVVIDPENRRRMREHGVVVNLTATAQAIRERLAADNERPLLQNDNSLEKIVSMLAEREPFYRDADIRIDTTGKGVDDIVLQILVWLKRNPDLETITVGLDERSYPIFFNVNKLSMLGSLCVDQKLGQRVAVVTNPTVGAWYFEPVRESLVSAGFSVHKIEVPDGEEYKNSDTLKNIYDWLIDFGLDRGSFIVALGGGVIGDMAGYAAATYLRGIPFVQVPTTLLAQVDSSVGGKTGINHEKGKNLIGAFYQPRLVMIDVAVLDTLAEREYLSGLAEMAKYGVVLDAEFFQFMYDNVEKLLARDKECLLTAVKRSCALKASVVERDEREGGLRAVLNYGHTIGHAVETLTGYRQYLHGEAVAIGMAQAAKISESMGFSSSDDTERVLSLLSKLKLPLDLPPFSPSEYIEAIYHDKKVRDGGLNFVFNKNLGSFTIATVADVSQLLRICGIGE